MQTPRWLRHLLGHRHRKYLRSIESARLEHCLDVPLRDILAVMQRRLTGRTRYFGIGTVKCPLDFWIYQELIFDQRPEVIIEIGNLFGGSTLALAHICDALGSGRIIAIDIDQQSVAPAARAHPRITWLEGDACDRFPDVQQAIGTSSNVLVIDDSSHHFDQTLAVLRTYSSLVRPGGWFIVEDGICGVALSGGPSPGPFEAVAAFLAEEPAFEAVREMEGFLITWNPRGFLRRVP